MSPVERAAKALADNHLLVSDGHYTDAARAVLQAVREPSEGMAKAGYIVSEELPFVEDHLALREPSRIWQAMIDKALSE